MKAPFFSIILGLGILTFITGCQKDTTKPSPQIPAFTDTIKVDNVTDPQDAIERIRYFAENISVRWGMNNGATGVLSGEYTSIQEEYLNLNDFNSNSPSNWILSYLWTSSFRAITFAEYYINFAKTDTTRLAASPEYLGTVYFYQAWAYFSTTRLFGKFYPEKDFNALGIPIFSMDESTPFKRNTIRENYDLIIADLEKAIALLPETNNANPSKYSAMALAAQAHLWFQNYDAAEVLLTQIFESGRFALLDNYAYLFDGLHENSSESIFETQFTQYGSNNYFEGTPAAQCYSVLLMGWNNDNNWPTKLTNYAAEEFGDDLRASQTYFSPGETMYNLNGNAITNELGYPFPKKYTNIPNIEARDNGTNICIIRLAELYLMYSEIQIRKGNNTQAAKYFNLVRERAGMPRIESPTMEDLMHEKFVELCTEGVYWYDIIRWDKAAELLANRNFIRGTHEALPIFNDVIEANPGIVQNSGY